MNFDPMFVMPGLVVLAVLCLMALFAALGIAMVGGLGGAAIMFFLQSKARARQGEALDSRRMWKELTKSMEQDRENL